MLKTLVCFALFAQLSTFAQADTPGEVAKSYFTAFLTKDYQKAANYFDPTSLNHFRKIFDSVAQSAPEAKAGLNAYFFGEDVSSDKVNEMTDAEFFAALFGRIMEMASQMGVSLEDAKVLGEVPDGTDTIHVVLRIRMKIGDTLANKVELVTTVKVNDGWKVAMPNEILTAIQGLVGGSQK